MARVIIGIDPGLKGAIAAINADGMKLLELKDTPTVTSAGKTLYDTPMMAHTLRCMSLHREPVIILEQQQAMPGQGVSSTFSTGYGFGLWCGILSALDLPFRTVRPVTWTKKVLSGTPGEGKARAIGFAMRMFPGAELTPEGCRKARDGRADAPCLAYWGAVA